MGLIQSCMGSILIPGAFVKVREVVHTLYQGTKFNPISGPPTRSGET